MEKGLRPRWSDTYPVGAPVGAWLGMPRSVTLWPPHTLHSQFIVRSCSGSGGGQEAEKVLVYLWDAPFYPNCSGNAGPNL